MARRCTICDHPEREAIETALVAGAQGFRAIARQWSVSKDAIARHHETHLPAAIARASQERLEEIRATALAVQVQEQETRAARHSVDLMQELERCFERVNLLFDACDRWLRDPVDPSRYDISPRAGEIQVVYEEPGIDDKPVTKKAKLSELLLRAEGAGVIIQRGEVKYADPRKLVLSAASTLRGNLELLAKLLGELKEGETHVNVTVSQEWVQVRQVLVTALEPYPEARVAVAEALRALEAGDGAGP